MTKLVVEAQVVGQKVLTADIRRLDLLAPELARSAAPGQFVNLAVSAQADPLLRRPLGVADLDPANGVVAVIYRIIGQATQILATACTGDKLSVIGPLGRGFFLNPVKPLLVGGGLGLAPLLYLAKSFGAQSADILIGGRSEQEIFWQTMFRDYCAAVHVTTDDGSVGTKGTVLALLPELLAAGVYDCVYVCGPEPMMKAVAQVTREAGIPCQISLEKYMACGIGACLSCSCGGVGKRLKVCTDGPVFWSEEVAEW